MVPKIVICASMRRSGSTLIFTLVNEILEKLTPKIPFIIPPTIERKSPDIKTFMDLSDWITDKHTIIIKTHEPITNIHDIDLSEVCILYSYRDPRDALLSESVMRCNPVLDYIDRLSEYRETYNYYTEELSSTVHSIDYQSWVGQEEELILWLLDCLHVKYNPKVFHYLKAEYSFDNQKRKLKNKAFTEPYIHSKHFQNGRVGRWKHELSGEVRETLNKECKKWFPELCE